MTESVDRTYDMLQRVGEFLKKAKPEHVEALLAGEAQLVVLLKGERVAKPAAPRVAKTAAPAAPAVSADQVAADLRSIGDRAAATRYVTDLGLKKAQLVQLAKDLNVQANMNQTAAKIAENIVEQKVGHRLTTNAILGSPTDSR